MSINNYEVSHGVGLNCLGEETQFSAPGRPGNVDMVMQLQMSPLRGQCCFHPSDVLSSGTWPG